MAENLPANVTSSPETALIIGRGGRGKKFKSDRAWVLGWSLFTLFLSSLPFIWGYLVTPSGGHFMGLVFNALDSNSYLAKMQEGARGEWRFSLVDTSEDHQGEYVYLFYLLLGKVQGLIGLPNILVFHIARVLTGLFLLLAGYRFIERYFREQTPRRIAFLLLCFSSGLGWLALLFGLTGSTDLWVAESNTFFTLLANPHYPLATGLLVLSIIYTQDGWEGKGWPAFAKAGTCAFLMGFVHPFIIVILGAVLGIFILRQTLETRHFVFSNWAGLALVGLSGAVGPVYSYLVLTGNPFLRVWLNQNQTLSPGPLDYLAGFGLVLGAALAGAWWVEKTKEVEEPVLASRWRLLTTWLIVNSLLLYLPVNLQRRLVEGLHIPLVCLAAAGIFYTWKLKPRWIGRFTLATTLTTVLLLALQISNLYARPDPNSIHPLYLYNEELQAMDWLKANTGWKETLLASPLLGNYLPTRAGNRVFYGHDLETINREAKAPLLGRFFRAEMSKTENSDFIRQYGLKYLYFGPEEISLGEGKFDPVGQGWPVVYYNRLVKIFRLF